MRTLGPISPSANILITGVDDAGMGRIRETLGAEAVLPTASIAYHLVYEEVERGRTNVVVVGFDEDFDEAIRLGTQINHEFPVVTLIALSTRSEPDRIRAAMRAGYREYVMLPDDADLLRHAVHEAVYSADPRSDEDRGEVIAVCSAKGGVGTTSLCINLAAELCPLHRVLVVDHCFGMGDVASFLDLRPKRSISDALRELERLDERMLAGSVAVHPSKVHILAQPNEIDEQEVIRGDAILRTLQICAESYQYVLVDCGLALDEATLTTITVADLIFLVCTPDVISVKNAWRRLQLFERIGVERERLRLIVNRWDKRAQLSVKDIETNLGLRMAARVTDDPKTMVQATNEGRLVRDVSKRSPAARDFSNLVTLVTDHDEFIEADEQEKSHALQWLFS